MLTTSWKRQRGPIGIDLGAHTIRMLQLEQRPQGWSVLAAAQQALLMDPGAAMEVRVAATQEAIGRMLQQGRFVGRKAVISLPAGSILYKNLRLPKMPPNEMKTAVEYEAADRFHLGLDRVQLRYLDAGEVHQGDEVRQEIILLAAPNDMVDRYLDMLIASGLDPVIMEAGSSALAHWLHQQGSQGSAEEDGVAAEAQVLLDLGYSSTKVLVVRHGRVLFFKLVEVGGLTLDQTMAQQLGMPLAEAAALRRQQMPAHDGDGDSEMLVGQSRRDSVERVLLESLRKVAADMAREISLCLRYYSVTFRGRRPDWAWVVGGESLSAPMRAQLAQGLGIELRPACPLEATDQRRAPLLQSAHRPLSEWAVAAGLALRGDSRAARKQVAA